MLSLNTPTKAGERTQSESGCIDVIKAAKCVIALSGWTKTPKGDDVYQSSYMAIETLRKAIEQAENPVLKLAPEPLPVGL